ncbi:MAG TPA: sugar nucleotide-binding protein [Patescibacteria group bacterium]|nr:sugar nucleotide-binding protein [Patescibacteria group bacterium]
MKTVAITAPTGMLGSMVYNVLKDKYNLVLVYRDEDKMKILDEAYGGVGKHKKVHFDLMDLYQDYVTGFPTSNIGPSTKKLVDTVGEIDAFINCAGIIKPHSLKDPITTMFINGAVPNILSAIYKDKLIQITTDCAYDGLVGAPYTEESPKTPNDLYGLSKSLGEPSQHSLVFRTSIIGPEITGFVSLISWFKKQEGQTIKGFTNHLWNGITTKEFGNICDRIVNDRSKYPKTGLYHIFSNDVSKYDMVMKFKEKYRVNVTIEKAAPAPVDRRMRSIYDLHKKLEIPSFDEMITSL